MERKPESTPSFIKVLLYDFTRRLLLPPLFVGKYGEILPKNVNLRTSSGETWNVELEQVDDKTYYFTRGWTKFAVDAKLETGEYVVFCFNVDKSTFDVSVYGYDCCGRQISGRRSWVDISDSDEDVKLNKQPIPINKDFREVKSNKQSKAYAVGKEAESDDTSESDDSQENDKNSEEDERPEYKICLKKYNKSRVRIGKDFALKAGLMRKKEVVLQCPPKQRCWPVKLTHYKKYSGFRLDMARGWGDFRRKNRLVYGETYVFECIPDTNVIEVKRLDGAN